MDPIAVIRTLWQQRWWVLPVFLATVAAAVYVFSYGPRSFETHVSYAIVNPTVPSDSETQSQPSPQKVNKNNPYLRSSDPTLVTAVLIARLSASNVGDELNARRLSSQYTVAPGATSNGFVVEITGIGPSADAARATTEALQQMLVSNLREMQKVYGADNRYLYTALPITPVSDAREQYSARLRSVIVVLLGGVILTFGAVSAGRYFAARRQPPDDSSTQSSEASRTATRRPDSAPWRGRRPLKDDPTVNSRDAAFLLPGGHDHRASEPAGLVRSRSRNRRG